MTSDSSSFQGWITKCIFYEQKVIWKRIFLLANPKTKYNDGKYHQSNINAAGGLFAPLLICYNKRNKGSSNTRVFPWHSAWKGAYLHYFSSALQLRTVPLLRTQLFGCSYCLYSIDKSGISRALLPVPHSTLFLALCLHDAHMLPSLCGL